MGLAAVALAALVALNLAGVTRRAPYILVGIALWVCVLKSGVHATLAGVATALAVPMAVEDARGVPPGAALQTALAPWVTWAILPLFAFANSGIALAGVSITSLLAPVPLGIALGLFLGKQVGVFGTVWLMVQTGRVALPSATTWLQIYGVALVAGIGFTMSLSIGTLAFEDMARARDVRLGVLSGSLLSAAAGYLVLRYATTSSSSPG